MMSDDVESLLSEARQARAKGDLTGARRGYERASEWARSAGDGRVLAHALRHISDIEREDGRPAEALAYGQEAVGLYRTLPDALPLDLANALRVTALAWQASAEFGEAFPVWREARDLYSQAGVEAGVKECEASLAHIAQMGAGRP